ncbi:MAG TPA: NAD(P)/FAD-dependent oxidoreductase [Verrucomicrobiae bacterium]|nr:NAD(P)/FAD-dependent oxidoreductase [Verrucomicrobiae bacterium]
MSEKKTQIIILGGGFGGMYCALELEKALARGLNADVVLVNKENFFLFTPMLHEVAASDLDITNIVNPVRRLLRRVKFFDGDVEYIDLTRKRVGVSHGPEHHHHDLDYDHLVVALGTVTNFYGIPGLEQRALTMKSLGDAIYLRNKLIENLEVADFDCCAADRNPLLTIVVAGGGFSGVETIASVNDFLRAAIRFYPNLREDMLRLVLVHPGAVILPELGEKLGRYAQEKLKMRGVEIRGNTKVASVTERGVKLTDGDCIDTFNIVWTAGTSPNPHLGALPCLKERGRVCVNEYLEVADWPGVWSLGDCATVPDLTTGKTCPPTAQHALRQGRVLAHNIVATIRGGKKKAFRFKTLGAMASIGRRAGVAEVFGFQFSGFVAWWMWRTIYLSKLPRFEKKFRVALDWTLDLLFHKDLVQFQTLRTKGVSHKEAEPPKLEKATE